MKATTSHGFATVDAVLAAVAAVTGQAPVKLPGVNEWRASHWTCKTPAALKIISTPGPDELHPATMFCVKCHRVELRDIPSMAAVVHRPQVSHAPAALSRVSPDGRGVLTLKRQGAKARPDLSFYVDGLALESEEFAISNRNARTKLLERCPAPFRDWMAGALVDLNELWSTTRPATAPKASDDQPRLTTDTEVWPQTVDPETVLNELLTQIRQHLALPEHGDIVVSLWIVMAHLVQHLRFAPYLWADSPVPGCGKTTLLEILELTTPRPWRLSNPTGAILFRTIERECPTLLLDELDRIPPGPKFDELTGVLNDGWHAGGKVARCVGEDNQVKTFSVFCCKAFAGIVIHFHEATLGRSLRLRMEPVKGEALRRLTSLRIDRAERWAAPLRRKLARLAEDAGPYIADVLQDEEGVMLPAGIDGRDAQAWEPLLAIADLVGGEWGTMARTACVAFVTARRKDNESDSKVRLLRDIRLFFDERGAETVTSTLLIEWLIEDESRGWAEYRGKGLTPESLAKLLKPFGVAPIRRREFTGNHRVWLRSALRPLWEKYLETPNTSQPVPAVPLVPTVPRPSVVANSATTLDDAGYLASLLADEATLEPLDDAA